ncbi:uncharacterized protein CLUP02_11376 [Colletotrichum lupini]|uniref:Uncharacterized protein n=1 Tax=Colletotrichum lupini TaxID=145971 RepID=A0A9Q8T0A3_9PEZI|nr:uncharacterized protein CLUP02_11376 [Colletotrichum lupini]UQC85877.1 hypothetical protein CLUP02_11376 [Colletotrichum lupini]
MASTGILCGDAQETAIGVWELHVLETWKSHPKEGKCADRSQQFSNVYLIAVPPHIKIKTMRPGRRMETQMIAGYVDKGAQRVCGVFIESPMSNNLRKFHQQVYHSTTLRQYTIPNDAVERNLPPAWGIEQPHDQIQQLQVTGHCSVQPKTTPRFPEEHRPVHRPKYAAVSSGTAMKTLPTVRGSPQQQNPFQGTIRVRADDFHSVPKLAAPAPKHESQKNRHSRDEEIQITYGNGWTTRAQQDNPRY